MLRFSRPPQTWVIFTIPPSDRTRTIRMLAGDVKSGDGEDNVQLAFDAPQEIEIQRCNANVKVPK